MLRSKVVMAQHKSNLYNNMQFENNLFHKQQKDVFGNRKKSVERMMPEFVNQELQRLYIETKYGADSIINEEQSSMSQFSKSRNSLSNYNNTSLKDRNLSIRYDTQRRSKGSLHDELS